MRYILNGEGIDHGFILGIILAIACAAEVKRWNTSTRMVDRRIKTRAPTYSSSEVPDLTAFFTRYRFICLHLSWYVF